jgi:hypothetical protein
LNPNDPNKRDSTMNLQSQSANAERSANDSKEIQPKVVTINPKDKPAVNHKDIKDSKDSKHLKDLIARKEQEKQPKDSKQNKPGKIDTNLKKDIKDMILDASPILKKDDEEANKSKTGDDQKKDSKDSPKAHDKLNREDSDAVERRNLVDLMQMTRPISPNDQYIDSLSQYQLEIRSDEKFHPGSKVYPNDKLDESDFDEVEEREKKIEDDVIQLSFDFEISRV